MAVIRETIRREQTQPGLIGRFTRRFYEARMKKAIRVVDHHRQFLDATTR
jgi:hypothetical protein